MIKLSFHEPDNPSSLHFKLMICRVVTCFSLRPEREGDWATGLRIEVKSVNVYLSIPSHSLLKTINQSFYFAKLAKMKMRKQIIFFLTVMVGGHDGLASSFHQIISFLIFSYFVLENSACGCAPLMR